MASVADEVVIGGAPVHSERSIADTAERALAPARSQ